MLLCHDSTVSINLLDSILGLCLFFRNNCASVWSLSTRVRLRKWVKWNTLVNPDTRKTLGCQFQKRGNLSSESVTMATRSLNPTWSGEGFLHKPRVSLSPPPYRTKNAVSFPHSFSQDYTEAYWVHSGEKNAVVLNECLNHIQKKAFF